MPKKNKRSHKVTLCKWAQPRTGRRNDGRGRGRSVALFAFSWADLAHLFGLKVPTVQKLAKRGVFDPTDLDSIVLYLDTRRGKIVPRETTAAVDPTPASVGDLN